jgi:hypothetical protein
MLKPSLRWPRFPPSWLWITIRPNSHCSKGVDPGPHRELIAHQQIHLRQMANFGQNRWLWRYLTQRTWRLEMEAEAFAVQLAIIEQIFEPKATHAPLVSACNALSDWPCLWCAPSADDARLAIEVAKAGPSAVDRAHVKTAVNTYKAIQETK